MAYRVLIAVQGEWWTDQRSFTTLPECKAHRAVVAKRWDDCDTAIRAPDDALIAFKHSRKCRIEQAALHRSMFRMRDQSSTALASIHFAAETWETVPAKAKRKRRTKRRAKPVVQAPAPAPQARKPQQQPRPAAKISPRRILSSGALI